MNKPFEPIVLKLHQTIRSRRIVELAADGTERVVEILETTGETIADEPCRPVQYANNVVSFAASLRRVG